MGELAKYIDGWLEFKDNSKVLAKVSRSSSRTLSNIYDGAVCKYSLRLKAVNCSLKKAPYIFYRVILFPFNTSRFFELTSFCLTP